MTPGWTLPWLAVALVVLAFAVAGAMRYRKRVTSAPQRRFEMQGAPVTLELQKLLGPYGQGEVMGVVQLKEGLEVSYSNGVHLSFVPVVTGKVGGVSE